MSQKVAALEQRFKTIKFVYLYVTDAKQLRVNICMFDVENSQIYHRTSTILFFLPSVEKKEDEKRHEKRL